MNNNAIVDAATLAQILLIGSQLVTLIQQIRAQTPTLAPEVWATVSSDYKAAVAAWDAVSSAVSGAVATVAAAS